MDLCRLCLQFGGQKVPNSDEVLDIFKSLFSPLNKCLTYSDLQLCEICLKSAQTLIRLSKCISKTNEKVNTKIQKSNLQLISLKNITGTHIGIRKELSTCRICLNITPPQVFLYDSDTNILRHDLIFSMLKYCNLMLNCDISEKHVMCLQCWGDLQICYSFKKNFCDIDRKIKNYFELFKISKKHVDDEVLEQMSKYFYEEQLNKTTINGNEDASKDNDIDYKKYSLRRTLPKKEYNEDLLSCKSIKREFCWKSSPKRTPVPKRNRHYFTFEEDEFLLETYIKITNTGRDRNIKPSNIIQQKWLDIFPSRPVSATSINRRLGIILQKKENKERIEQMTASQNRSTTYKIETDDNTLNIFSQLPLDNPNVDSEDDSVIDEVISSSFTPQVKYEPLSDIEETYEIEPTLEPPPSETESDAESLPIPILERMDTTDLKIDEIYSIDVKRETLNAIYNNEDDERYVVVKNYKGCQRVTMRDRNSEEALYKCTMCNFKTKYQYSANRHSSWHANPKKSFDCKMCSFATSTSVLLNNHVIATHYDIDLPQLIPYT